MSFLIKKLKPFTAYMILTFVCILVTTFADLNMPNMLSKIINTGIINSDYNYIISIAMAMLGIALLGAIATIGKSYFSAKIASGFSKDMRKEVFCKIENFSLAEFDRFGTSSLITRSTNDINQLQQVVMMAFRMLLTAPFMAVGGIVMAYSKSRKLSFIVLLAMPFIFIVARIIQKKAVPLSKQIQSKIDKVNLVMREKLRGVRVIRAFNTEKFENERFDDANKDLTDTSIKTLRIMSFMMPGLSLIMNITTVVIVWSGGVEVSYGNMMVGDIMALVQYVMQIMMSMTMMSMVFVMIPRAAASIDRLKEILDTVPQIKNPKTPKEANLSKGEIEFNNVNFAYPNAQIPALSNISFKAKSGETTAIIGSTGSGKSTLANLILRFYDTTSGEILIDGINIKDINQETLRLKIGYVPQKAVLFKGSIKDNILNGDEKATDDMIKEAAQIAQSEDFILAKEQGFDSAIAQGGQNVSGGQKQRLSIARAVVRKPQIYIFDDSFSALDFKTDLALRNALKPKTQNSTVIIIAQRISTIKEADNIIVLDDGKIVGMGKHSELIVNCNVYNEIVNSQLSKEEVDK